MRPGPVHSTQSLHLTIDEHDNYYQTRPQRLVAPHLTVVTPPRGLPVDSSAWEVVPGAWGPPRAGEGRDGSTTPTSSTDDRSDPPPSRACVPATSAPRPPPCPGRG